MRKTFRRTLIVGALWAALSLPLAATTIYDNSSTDLLTRFHAVENFEFGDQIVLDGTDRFVTAFSFEFFGASANGTSFAGPVSANVRFYSQDGPVFNGQSSPGTLLWSSGWVPLTVTSRSTLNFSQAAGDFGAGVFLPQSQMTWSVEFFPLSVSAGDDAGLDVYGPPTVGNNFPDYWQRPTGGTWALMTNTISMDFAARLEAAVIPEPASLGLSVFGGLSLLLAVRMFRRK